MSERVEWLRRELGVLSRQAELQIRYLEEQGMPGHVDELALDFDAIASPGRDMFENGEITAPVLESTTQLLDHLTSFSGQINAHLWTPEGLKTAAQWEKVRRMAKDCLALLG